MRVKRNRLAECDTAYVLKSLETKDNACGRYGTNCYECPKGKLRVFDEPTYHELAKLKNRLELVYKVVETL